MAKEDIFSKINLKDYNNILENILEQKAFTEDVKNLLLSMLYKIENGYQDYQTVKINVNSKKYQYRPASQQSLYFTLCKTKQMCYHTGRGEILWKKTVLNPFRKHISPVPGGRSGVPGSAWGLC